MRMEKRISNYLKSHNEAVLLNIQNTCRGDSIDANTVELGIDGFIKSLDDVSHPNPFSAERAIASICVAQDRRNEVDTTTKKTIDKIINNGNYELAAHIVNCYCIADHASRWPRDVEEKMESIYEERRAANPQDFRIGNIQDFRNGIDIVKYTIGKLIATGNENAILAIKEIDFKQNGNSQHDDSSLPYAEEKLSKLSSAAAAAALDYIVFKYGLKKTWSDDLEKILTIRKEFSKHNRHLLQALEDKAPELALLIANPKIEDYEPNPEKRYSVLKRAVNEGVLEEEKGNKLLNVFSSSVKNWELCEEKKAEANKLAEEAKAAADVTVEGANNEKEAAENPMITKYEELINM